MHLYRIRAVMVVPPAAIPASAPGGARAPRAAARGDPDGVVGDDDDEDGDVIPV